MMAHMTRETLYKNLFRHEMTLADACAAIHLRTGAIIKANTVSVQLNRYGHLSEPQRAAFGMLFNQLDGGPRDRTA